MEQYQAVQFHSILPIATAAAHAVATSRRREAAFSSTSWKDELVPTATPRNEAAHWRIAATRRMSARTAPG